MKTNVKWAVQCGKWLFMIVLVLSGVEAWASAPCGIYVRIDEVTLGPSADQPTWVLIKGDFVLALDSRRLTGPERGYVCFSLTENDRTTNGAKYKDKCLIEWADMKGLVDEKGKGTAYVAFGSVLSEVFRDSPNVRATPEAAKAHPTPYPIHHGLTRLRAPDPQEADSASRELGNRNPVIMLRDFQNKNGGAAR